MNRDYSVYVHIFPNGKTYVGLTKQDPNVRWNDGDGYKKQPVYNAILEYGWDNIEHIVYSGYTRKEAQKKEIELIECLDSINNGYNISIGGGCGGNPWVTYIYNGDIYSADELASLSDIEGLTGHDITNRINYHGHSIEEALTIPLVHKNQKVLYNGEYYTYNELAEMSNVDGINGSDINLRLKRGWDIERALTQPKNVKRQPHGVGKRIFEYDGQMLNSYELWLLRKNKDLSQNIITNRICKHGWSVEDAITIPPKRYGVLYQYKGEEYTTDQLAKLYPENNLENYDITGRLRMGWSVEKAVETPKSTFKKYEYNGGMYTLKQIYDMLPDKEVSYTTFYRNFKKGISIEEACKKMK